MRRIACVIAALLVPAAAVAMNMDSPRIVHLGALKAPRQQYPLSGKVDLSGKAALEFKWWNEYVAPDHFVLKIYKGFATYGANLVYAQEVSGGASTCEVKADLFSDGTVYTWTLMAVARGGEKSEKSQASFTAVRK